MTLDDIEQRLAGMPAEESLAAGLVPAAVALLVATGTDGPEILFIERANHPGDPWSGDLGFPGGKVEPVDATPQAAAERETVEELGLDLRRERRLGRLADIAGAHLPVRVSCFVYGLTEKPPLQLSAEVRDAFWVPLRELAEPARRLTAPVRFGGETLERPAIRLPQAGKPVLWGITYRLVIQFLARLTGEDERP